MAPNFQMEEFPDPNATKFDWDEHLSEIQRDEIGHSRDRRTDQAIELAAGNEWFPKDRKERLMYEESGGVVWDDDDDPIIPKMHWDDVDPKASRYRNPPAGGGYTWSRIHNKEAYPQYDFEERRLAEGYAQFDFFEQTIPDTHFDAEIRLHFGHIDPVVVATLMPVLDVLADTVKIMEATTSSLKFKYMSDAKNRIGIEIYARRLIHHVMPHLTEHDIFFDSFSTVDGTRDGIAVWTDSDKGDPTDLF